MRRLLAVLAVVVGLLVVGLPLIARAAFDPTSQACDGVSSAAVCQDAAAGNTQTVDSNRLYGKDGIFTKGANLVSFIVGVGAVISIVVGGFKYVTSAGDTSRATDARRTILFSAIGILVTLMAQALIFFVFDRL
jgi:hypothetical protein